MMNNNQNFRGWGQPQGTNMGVGFANNNQQPVAMNQLLTKEQAAKLQQTGPKFNFKLTELEYYRAICTHKYPDTGVISLKANDDGTHTCGICHETFTLLDPEKFERGAIEDICSDFNDLFQTIKTMYGPIPSESGKELYTFIGFINRMPALYEVASEYFGKIDKAGLGVEENKGMYGSNLLYAMMNGSGFPTMGNAAAMNYNSQPTQQDPRFDPNYQAWLQSQQVANQGNAMQSGGQGQFVSTPGQPNPAFAPSGQGQFVNPVGFVETEQTVSAGVPTNPAQNGQVSMSFKD